MDLVHIPHRFANSKDPIRQVLKKTYTTLPFFVLRSQEARFCRLFLQKYTNWWLFRCNQKSFMGDFVLVDMSVVDINQRRIWLLELKSGQRDECVQEKQGMQMGNSAKVREVLLAKRLISSTSILRHIHSQGDELIHNIRILDFL